MQETVPLRERRCKRKLRYSLYALPGSQSNFTLSVITLFHIYFIIIEDWLLYDELMIKRGFVRGDSSYCCNSNLDGMLFSLIVYFAHAAMSE